MKTKLVIFDLDGVLVEAKNIHYDALNQALGDDYAISWKEHLSTYDGLKTFQKLDPSLSNHVQVIVSRYRSQDEVKRFKHLWTAND